MSTIVLVIHLMVCLALIAVVLLQRSEGGALGIGGGGGGMMSGRGPASMLTRMTAVLAGVFFLTSIALTILAGQPSVGGGGILDRIDRGAPASGGSTPSTPGSGGILDKIPGAPSAPTPPSE